MKKQTLLALLTTLILSQQGFSQEKQIPLPKRQLIAYAHPIETAELKKFIAYDLQNPKKPSIPDLSLRKFFESDFEKLERESKIKVELKIPETYYTPFWGDPEEFETGNYLFLTEPINNSCELIRAIERTRFQKGRTEMRFGRESKFEYKISKRGLSFEVDVGRIKEKGQKGIKENSFGAIAYFKFKF